MKKLWNKYGRITAWIIGLFLIFISMSASDRGIVRAAEETGLSLEEESETSDSDVTPPEISKITVGPTVYSYVHGNYAKETVQVKIIAKDAEDGAVVSGLQKLRFFFGDTEEAFKEIIIREEIPEITDAEAYEFHLELTPDIAELAELTDIQISAVDKEGNESDRYELFDSGNGFVSNLFLIDQSAPSIVRGNLSGYVKTDENGTILSEWYTEIPEKLVFVCSDKTEGNMAGSGLLSATVILDDTELTNCTVDNKNEKTAQQEMEMEIRQADMDILSKGEHSFVMTAKDFAENAAVEEFIIGIDDGAPIVTDVKFETTDVWNGRLGTSKFGSYHNKSVKLLLTIADTVENGSLDTSKPCVGAKEAELYLNGVLYKTIEVKKNHAEFIIPEKLSENQFYKYTQISVITRDFLGNQSEQIFLKEIQDEGLVIETKKPVIMDVDIKTAGENALRTEKTEASAVFYCKSDENGKPDITLKVSASDKDDNSGLDKIEVILNGQTVFTDTYEENLQLFAALMEEEKIFDLKTDVLAEADDYKGSIIVTDKAGNKAFFDVTVYVDNDGPDVWLSDMTEPVSKVNRTFYYGGDVFVEMKAKDQESGVGVRAIEWGVLQSDREEKRIELLLTGEKETASFVIAAPEDTVYAEQLYMKAIDKLDNTGRTVLPGKVVIETQEAHDKQKEKHISVEAITKTSHKDADGNLLYTKSEHDTVSLGVVAADRCNGIGSIDWTIKMEDGTYQHLSGQAVANSETFTISASSGKWNIEEGTDFVSRISGEIMLDTSVIEANHITVTVTMTDLSGNISTDSMVVSVDNTIPVITVEFDDVLPDSEFTNVYKETCTATIRVTDRNFGVDQFTIEITNKDGLVPQISDWMTKVNEDIPDTVTNEATLVFAEDGDYKLSISGQDLAGLEADTVIVEEFIIDKTDPVIKVAYTNENAVNAGYYADTQTAVITIEEHNFAEERIKIIGDATLDGADMAFPVLGAWSSDGDTHTAVLTFDQDGLYRFRVDYKDKAGREAEPYTGEAFYVDRTAPVIEITGVEDMSANNGDVAPRISITDSNYNPEGVTIALYGANGGQRTIDGTYSSQAGGQIFTFDNFEEKQSNDDIYTVKVTALDMAGNESTGEITFSVNRFGSVYVFDPSLKEIAGMYVQEEIDVRVTEVNVDRLKQDEIRVVVNANGSITELREEMDYTVLETGGNGAWYQYEYVIDKSLFAADGSYIVTLYSKDAAGNTNENMDESKKAEISFGIDKTPPIVIPIDIASEEQYAEDGKTAIVAVNDNLVLQEVSIFVGGNRSEYTVEGENYSFRIPGSDEQQNITIAAVDAAGNRTNYIISGVLVTTNAFIRWYHNTPLFVGSIAGVIGFGGAGAGFIGLRRRRRLFLKNKA